MEFYDPPSHSFSDPSSWALEQGKKVYPTCIECATMYGRAWHTSKFGEMAEFIHRWHDTKHKKHHEGNGVQKSAWAFTLTKSPSDDLTVADMIAAARKVMRQKSCPVKKYAWYLEYKGVDEAGLPAHPHIHGMYETESGYKIEEKHFARVWKIWRQKDKNGDVIMLGSGWRGGYHEAVHDTAAYKDYIKKDGGIGESNGLE